MLKASGNLCRGRKQEVFKVSRFLTAEIKKVNEFKEKVIACPAETETDIIFNRLRPALIIKSGFE